MDAYYKYKPQLEIVIRELHHLDTELRALDAQYERTESQFVISPTLSVSEDAPSSILRSNSFIEPPGRPLQWGRKNFDTVQAWKRIQQSPSWQREMAKRRRRAAAARKEAEDKFAQSIAESAAEAERLVATTISEKESTHLAVLSSVVNRQLNERARGSFLPDI